MTKKITSGNFMEKITQIQVGDEYIAEKTSDKFREVVFSYEDRVWIGVVPILLRYQGFDAKQSDTDKIIEHFYFQLDFRNLENWKKAALEKWKEKKTQTFKVFEALLSGEWECRVCGPVPKVNPQAASRIRDIKKKGFVIASKRNHCESCDKTQMHDLLLMADLPNTTANPELRKPIPDQLAKRIVLVLESTECVFSQVRTKTELVIDHKFPSQRWTQPESDNVLSMTEDEIKVKFQLLSNQTNMLKSRECDRCVREGLRGQFMGIRWYYHGNKNWEKEYSDPSGCIGCPWFDLNKWKEQLMKNLSITHRKEAE